MKRSILILILAVFIGLSSAPGAFAENLLSLNVGVFSPGDDYSDAYDDGGDFGIYYTNASSSVGFEVGFHGYSIDSPGNDVGVVGLEFLVTFQTPGAGFQPYAGIGLGVYDITNDPSIGPVVEVDGSGVVLELGFRSFLNEIFMGFQIKGFTNEWDEGPSEFDYGGISANIVIGTVF